MDSEDALREQNKKEQEALSEQWKQKLAAAVNETKKQEKVLA
jgi:hypothetical protein